MEAAGTRQLDFNQAMTDFSIMFPAMQPELIETVLRANDGAVDATIDELLTRAAVEGAENDFSGVHTPNKVSLPAQTSTHSSELMLLIPDETQPSGSDVAGLVTDLNGLDLTASMTDSTDSDSLSQQLSNSQEVPLPPKRHSSHISAAPQHSSTLSFSSPPQHSSSHRSVAPAQDRLSHSPAAPQHTLPQHDPSQLPTSHLLTLGSSSPMTSTSGSPVIDSTPSSGASPSSAAKSPGNAASAIKRRLDWLEDSSSSSSPPPQDYLDLVSADMKEEPLPTSSGSPVLRLSPGQSPSTHQPPLSPTLSALSSSQPPLSPHNSPHSPQHSLLSSSHSALSPTQPPFSSAQVSFSPNNSSLLPSHRILSSTHSPITSSTPSHLLPSDFPSEPPPPPPKTRAKERQEGARRQALEAACRRWGVPLLRPLPDDFLRVPRRRRRHLVHSESARAREHHCCSKHRHSTRQRARSPPLSKSGLREVARVHRSSDSRRVQRSQSSLQDHSVLHERLQLNTARRASAAEHGVEPAVEQYLSDERLALALQNEEFLRELRTDEDFMRTLRNDPQLSSTSALPDDPDHVMLKNVPGQWPEIVAEKKQAGSAVQSARGSKPFSDVPEHMIEGYGGTVESSGFGPFSREVSQDKTVNKAAQSPSKERPASVHHQGYGDAPDHSSDPFPFSRRTHASSEAVENEELRKQLGHMSMSTKRKFAIAARRFFSRRPRSTKKRFNRLHEVPTPSTINLLDDGDEHTPHVGY